MVTSLTALTGLGVGRLGGRRRPGEVAEVLGRRVGRNVRESFVPRRRCRADARRAHPGVAGLLAEATSLAEAGDVAGGLEAKVTATDHVLHHAAELLPALAGVLDHHRLPKVPPLRDETNVPAAKQRRLVELALLLAGRGGAGDRYVRMKVVLAVGDGATFRADAATAAADADVLRGGCSHVEIVLPGQLGSRGRFRAHGSSAGGILVSVVAAGVPRELATIKR